MATVLATLLPACLHCHGMCNYKPYPSRNDNGFIHQSNKCTVTCKLITLGIQRESKEMLKGKFQGNNNIGLCSINVDIDQYASMLQNCNTLVVGKQIHAHMLKSGIDGNVYLETRLLTMYGNCSSLVDARLVFDKMSKPNVFSWSAIIGVYAKHWHCEEALALFYQAQREEIHLEYFIFPTVLKACAGLEALERGKEIHCYVIKLGLMSNIFVGNGLVDMYGKCGNVDSARQVFDKMFQRDLVSWTVMVAAYAQNGHAHEALRLFKQMQLAGVKPNVISWNGIIGGFVQSGYSFEALQILRGMQLAGVKPNSVTVASVLPACASLGTLQQGKEIHDYIIRSEFQSNAFVGNALIDMYAKCGVIECAREVFDKMPQRNTVSWNTVISGYSQSGYADEALKLFCQMQLTGVKQSVVSWNAMIAGCAQNGQGDEALKLFHQMQLADVKPTSFTFGSVLLACANLAALERGKEIHSYIITSGFVSSVFVGTALVDMYSKCQRIEDARRVFDKISEKNRVSWNAMIAGYAQNNRGDEALKLFDQMQLTGLNPDVVSWNAMITGYVQNGHGDEALKLFRQMQLTGMEPDSFTYGSVLQACARLAALDQGKEIHAYIISNGLDSDAFVGSALVDMYAKCGSLGDARSMFDKTSKQDVVSWNAMIAGCALHGHGKESLSLFYRMQKAGIKPDHITFISILSACSHAGLVDEGRAYFDCMTEDYRITPSVEHYTCMVDLLGRAGYLNEAYDFIKNMPLEPDAVVWGALLGACRVHCNTDLGERVADQLFRLEPENAGNYLLLSNIYAVAGRWDGLARVRKIMKDRVLKKRPGCSWIKVKNRLHVFVAGDKSHPQTEEIYAMLENMASCMKKEGYMPTSDAVLHDVE